MKITGFVRASGRRWLAVAAVVAGFAATRVAWARAGVKFRAESLDFFAQFLDPPLLRDHLFQSLWNLHAQPPLLNLAAGIALKLSPEHPGGPLRVLFLVAGLASCLAMFGILRRLRTGTWPAAALAVALTATPPFLLYENWLFYPHLAQALLLGAGWFLLASEGRPGRAMGTAFGALAALALLRSLFHPLYLLLAAGAAVAMSPAGSRRRAVRTVAPPVAVVLLLAAKNLAMFGFFGTSSWGGNSLHRMMTESIDPAEVRRMVDEGLLHPISLEWEFSPPETYLEVLGPAPDRGVPALDTTGKTRARENAVNYNHRIYPAASREYLRGALAMMREHPDAYARSMRWTSRRFLDPVTDDRFLGPNRIWMKDGVRRTEAIERSLVYRLALAAGLLWAIARAVRRGVAPAERLFLAFAAGTILWVAACGIALEYGENNRFRYQVLGLAWILALAAAANGVAAFRGAVGRIRD